MYYNPYSLISDMRGLGADASSFVAPAVIPNPRAGKVSAEKWLLLWGEWAAAREVVLRDWASVLDELVALKAATCADLAAYNQAALTHWAKEVVVSVKMIKAGAKVSEVPKPPLPAIFAAEVRVVDQGEGAFSIQHRLPCARDSRGKFTATFPDFAQLRVFGKESLVAGGATPRGGEAQLGLFLAAGAPWAAEVFTTIIVSAIAGATIAFSIDRLIDGFTGEEIKKINADMKRGSEEAGLARSKAQLQCVTVTIAATGGAALSVDDLEKIRAGCARESLAVSPIVEIPKEGIGFGTSILLGGLGVAVVIGAVAVLRSQRS
jgi:hypothetical protein